MLKMLAPIVLFVYNRPDHTRLTVDALKKNVLAPESELFIYSDAAKNEENRKSVEEVRAFLKTINGFKTVTVIERKTNWGLANSIIDGVSKIVKRYGKIIVLEDDLVTSPNFLTYMNNALDFYQDDNRILSISGYSLNKNFMTFPCNYVKDIYLHIRPMSWGWATWESRWAEVNWDVKEYRSFMWNPFKIMRFNKGGTDLSNMLKVQKAGKIDSWYIRWAFHAYLKRQYTIYPVQTLITNIGYDNSGVHCENGKTIETKFYDLVEDNMLPKLEKDIQIDEEIMKQFSEAFNLSYWNRIKWFIKNILWKLG